MFLIRCSWILVYLILGILGSLDLQAGDQSSDSSYAQEIKKKTYQEWMRYFYGYIYPSRTSAEVMEDMAKKAALRQTGEQQSPFLHAGQSAGKAGPDEKAESFEPSMGKKVSLPKGVYGAVAIPKGSVIPSSITEEAVSDMKQVQAPKPGPYPSTGSKELKVVEKLPSSSTAHVGFWSGEYSKLIEYYDADSRVWKPSENSLRNVPVELNVEENGSLNYKMPEREGFASYRIGEGLFAIICNDVRVRGEYVIEQGNAQDLKLKTSRVLVKDKIRMSLEFKLVKKAV